LTSPSKWSEVNNNNDKAGRAIYLSSDIGQSQLNEKVNFVYKIVNQELCKLAGVNGGTIDPSKIYIGGKSQGSLLTAAVFMRMSEFVKSPLGGAFGFIGLVPTLFQNPSTYQTGANSAMPEASTAQKNFIQQSCARFMWGAADSLFPSGINRITYEMLAGAFGTSGRLTTDEQAGVGHTTQDSDWTKAGQWFSAAKSGSCSGN
jgi:hypothetical protein